MTKIVSNVSSQQEASLSVSTDPIEFTVRRGFEGKQIIVEWNINALSATRIILMRKQFSHSQNINDGIVLLDESPVTSVSYIDLDIDELKTFYYTLFYEDPLGNLIQDFRLRGNAFTCTTGLFRQELWKLLPRIYRSEDKNTTRFNLENQLFPSINEYLHLNLGPTERDIGQLRRFLYLFGLFFDDTKCLIDYMPNLWDVDNAPAEFLQYIADLVAIEFNFELPIDRQRIEIREAVATYKTKGTLSGIESHAQKINGLDATVDEFVDNILVSNREDRLSIDFGDLEQESLIGKCGDPFHYSLDLSDDSFYSFEKLLICLDIPENTEVTQRKVEKLSRTLVDWIPADTDSIIIYEDKNGEDFYTPANSIEESLEDSTETRSFLISQSITLFSNDVDVLSQDIV